MFFFSELAATLCFGCSLSYAKDIPWRVTKREIPKIPKTPSGVTQVISPQGVKITYKQPGKHGICETKKGVEDYAGYVSLNNETNIFFW